MRQLKYAFCLITVIAFSLVAAPARAQSPLTAEVDRAGLSTDESVTLTVVVTGSALNPPQPSLPPLDGFEVIGSSSSSQISIVNGNVTAQGVYRYRLRPLQTGELVIGPVSATINGQSYTTDPIAVQVTPGNAPATPPEQAPPAPDTLSGQDFFVEAEVDNPTPYLGQQVTYTFRFYQGLNLLDQPRYTPPPFTGFWNRKQPEQTQYTIHAGQRAYRVTELRTLLFPTIAGETTIEPAELTIPGGPFQTGQSLHTRPATVNVQPLPPGAPPDFNGAVGQFNLTASLDATKGTVNEPLTLRVTLSGQGNIESLPLPNWPDLPNWRTFESKATTNTRFENGQLSGSRIFERLLVPAAPGQFTIPAITYPYFDPLAGEYRTAAAGPISVTIVPAADEPPIPAPPGSAKEAVERLASDIRHIKPVPPLLQSAPPPVTTRPGYWLAWGVPPVLLAANYLWQRRQARRRRHSALFRSLQAQKRALKALALARKQRQDPYASGGQILTAYLSDKLNRPVGGLTRTELEKILAAKGVPPAHLARLNACLLESDTGRYSPAAAGPDRAQRLLNQIETLINELETSFTG